MISGVRAFCVLAYDGRGGELWMAVGLWRRWRYAGEDAERVDACVVFV